MSNFYGIQLENHRLLQIPPLDLRLLWIHGFALLLQQYHTAAPEGVCRTRVGEGTCRRHYACFEKNIPDLFSRPKQFRLITNKEALRSWLLKMEHTFRSLLFERLTLWISAEYDDKNSIWKSYQDVASAHGAVHAFLQTLEINSIL